MYMRNAISIIVVFTLTVLAGVVTAHGSKAGAKRRTRANERPAFRPVIEFGHQGGNLRPYRIGIDASGRVKVLQGVPQLKVESIPAEKVSELVREASDEDFWKTNSADDEAAGKILPDFGFVFVKVHASGRRLIYHHGRHTGPLGRFYTELSELILA